MSAEDKRESPVIKLITVIWQHANEATGHSWARLNRSLHQALELSILSGMKFGRDDFKEAHDQFRGGYWMTNPEGFYSTAIESGNDTAAISFEKWMNRKPFFFTEILWRGKTGGRKRLHEGSEFEWNGESVKVTSFTDDEESLVACSYHEKEPTKENPYPRDKVLHRYVIKRQELAKSEKAKVAKVQA